MESERKPRPIRAMASSGPADLAADRGLAAGSLRLLRHHAQGAQHGRTQGIEAVRHAPVLAVAGKRNCIRSFVPSGDEIGAFADFLELEQKGGTSSMTPSFRSDGKGWLWLAR